MTIQLYDDQLDLRERTREAMRRHKCILVHAVTGAGKTVIAADMIARARQNNRTATFMVPRRQLLRQSADKFTAAGIDFGYITAGKKPSLDKPIQVATLGTLVKREHVPADVLFVDEGHYSFEQSLPVVQSYLVAGKWVVYLTATPKPGMDATVQEVVVGESLGWMIRNKRLSSYRPFCVSSPDLSMIRKVAGEYHQGQLCDKMEHDRKLVGNMVEHYKLHAWGKRTIAYATSIKHAEIMAEMFRLAGIPSAAIHGNTSDEELVRIIQAFARGEIWVLTNCDMATFGFDLSAASGMDVTIEAMIDGVPTLSIIKQSQKWGRVLRMKDDPALILDHAGNILHRNGERNHGLPCEDRVWAIRSGEQAGRPERATSIKQCPKCFAAHDPAPACPYCSHTYMVNGRVIRQVDGMLVEVPIEQPKPPRVLTADERIEMAEKIRKAVDGAIEAGVPAHAARTWAQKKIAKEMGVV